MKLENEATSVGGCAGKSPDGLMHGARRDFLLGAAGAMATLAGVIPAAKHAAGAEPTAGPLFAYVGCFSSASRKADGKGISLYRIDPDGAWTLLQTIETLPN